MKRLNQLEVEGLRAHIANAPAQSDGFKLITARCGKHQIRVSPTYESDLRFGGGAALREFWRIFHEQLMCCLKRSR